MAANSSVCGRARRRSFDRRCICRRLPLAAAAAPRAPCPQRIKNRPRPGACVLSVFNVMCAQKNAPRSAEPRASLAPCRRGCGDCSVVGNAAGRYFTIRSVVYVVVTAGVKLGRIPPDLRSGTSYLRSIPLITDPVPHNRDPSPFCWDPQLCTVYILVFFSVRMMFCTNVVLYGHFVICICPCSWWIDVASIKHYSNAIKAKQSALNARKPLVGGREPYLCSRLFRLELRPFRPRAYRDPPPLLE